MNHPLRKESRCRPGICFQLRGQTFLGRTRWRVVFILTIGLIYGTLAWARSVSLWANATLGRETVRFLVGGGYGISFFLIYVWFKRLGVDRTGLSMALGLMILTGFCLLPLHQPEERIHFMEYIVVVFLAYRAFPAGKFMPGLLRAAAVGVGVGIVDEVIQFFLPMRVFDWRDIGFNTLGSLIGAGFVWARRRHGSYQ